MSAPTIRNKCCIGALWVAIYLFLSFSSFAQDASTISIDEPVSVKEDSQLAKEELSPSIVLLENTSSSPTMLEVSDLLLSDLERIGVRVRIDTIPEYPLSQDDWSRYTIGKAKESIGLLAVFSWNCPESDVCFVYMVEPQSLALVSFPIGKNVRKRLLRNNELKSKDIRRHEVTAKNIAAGIREILYEDALLTFPKVSRRANRSSKVNPEISPQLVVPKEEQPAKKTPIETFTPSLSNHQSLALWLDFGYWGAYPYPSPDTVHGVLLGTTFYVKKHFAPSLQAGFLGRRKNKGENGVISAYHFPFALHLKFPISIGPAIFSIAPVIQIDAIRVRKNPTAGKLRSYGEWNLSFGGATTWNVPMPKRDWELFFGAGILATVVSPSYSIAQEVIMADTRLHFFWLAGMSWNIISK